MLDYIVDFVPHRTHDDCIPDGFPTFIHQRQVNLFVVGISTSRMFLSRTRLVDYEKSLNQTQKSISDDEWKCAEDTINVSANDGEGQ